MSYAHKIIEKFGGTRALASAMGIPPTTVQSWKDTGLIPAKHQQPILHKARELGFDITPDDFFGERSDSTSHIQSETGAAP